MIAVTPDRLCHGVLNWCTVVREPGSLGQDKEGQRLIEEKESFRWLEGYRVASGFSGEQPDMLFVYGVDRKADTYEIYAERYWRIANREVGNDMVLTP